MTIFDVINDCFSAGDSFVPIAELYDRWDNASGYLPEALFQNKLRLLQETGSIIIENQNVYLPDVWQQEEFVAKQISERLLAPPLPAVRLPDILKVGEKTLAEGQKNAVEMALNNRLSLILGGAGTGKTTLIKAIIEHADSRMVLCSPTAKAAINLTYRTGEKAATVHRTLGVLLDGSFANSVPLNGIGMIIVDEAGMLTLDMLAGLLKAAPKDCRIVLVGDECQLPPVGVGHVLRDLEDLPMPCVRLERNHRQHQTADALHHNVTRFEEIYNLSDLAFDESFLFRSGANCLDDLAQKAVKPLIIFLILILLVHSFRMPTTKIRKQLQMLSLIIFGILIQLLLAVFVREHPQRIIPGSYFFTISPDIFNFKAPDVLDSYHPLWANQTVRGRYKTVRNW